MYGFTTTLSGTTFEQALAKTIAALKTEGFGVLSDIDVQHAMKDKLGVAMPPHRILGAFNPALKTVADAAEERLRRACQGLGGSATQTT